MNWRNPKSQILKRVGKEQPPMNKNIAIEPLGLNFEAVISGKFTK